MQYEIDLSSLLLLTDAFKRFRIGLLIDKLAGVGIALCPALVLWIVSLRTILDGALSMSVTLRRIGCHNYLLPFIRTSTLQLSFAAVQVRRSCLTRKTVQS